MTIECFNCWVIIEPNTITTRVCQTTVLFKWWCPWSATQRTVKEDEQNKHMPQIYSSFHAAPHGVTEPGVLPGVR